MAPGYTIALVLIGTGAVLFVIALVLLRQEARAKADGLSTLLRMGKAPAFSAPRVRTSAAEAKRPVMAIRPQIPSTTQADASQALQRAYPSCRVRSASFA
jgi:hypothetical protein